MRVSRDRNVQATRKWDAVSTGARVFTTGEAGSAEALNRAVLQEYGLESSSAIEFERLVRQLGATQDAVFNANLGYGEAACDGEGARRAEPDHAGCELIVHLPSEGAEGAQANV